VQTPEKVSKADWQAWVRSGPTQWFLWVLMKKREAIGEWVLNGGAEDRADFLHREIGQCMALIDSIEYATKTFDYIEKEEPKDEAVETSFT
jgi:hypothetical protein